MFTTHMKFTGFSLIEVLITLALCAVLLTLTLPTYQSHIQISYRQQTLLTLEKATNQLTTHYIEQRTYENITLKDLSLDTHLINSYRFQLTTNTTHFQLSAIPEGTQAHDACGTLSVDEMNHIRSTKICALSL